ncbi:endonuclease MutS2 [Flammeovirga kamogawensis]|uniref:Endonuclease MutS2 n=1 Tax=Flammeovirga kamogawensis TaxID=373891 RepID=A0ABX8GVW7_9BACT|nr:Smr/MutS family protein [Flammeovirga kamogawensis]MBB6461594.1 DNA mismatch repair protein MutS2 [Flammeovirga kamogawensis]QWG07476.1 Smr/MutS family protein [Flammeovirga kamogawensis]TRX69289.1 endonuclease MutS2 [Flammeovirga kamogawensis]
MLYPKNLEEKLGFDKLREILKDKCNGAVGRSYVDKMRFTSDPRFIRQRIAQVDECVRIYASGESFPHSGFIDVENYLDKAEIVNAFLLEDELFDLKTAFTTLKDCLTFFNTADPTLYPELVRVSEVVEFNPMILSDIDMILDDKGKIRDNASPELVQIRRALLKELSSLRSRTASVLQQMKKSGYAKDDAIPTLREGRIVVPVPAEHKRHVTGFVHDASSTGQTVFIEPQELLQLNNTIKDLELRERQEVIRILTEITNKIRPQIPGLRKGNNYLGIIDFINAKANFAMIQESIKPVIVDEPLIAWYHVAHPLLLWSFMEQSKQGQVVRQKIELDEERGRILIISGPNAGGKSIAMQTVALVQYMFQCGMLVPMVEGSKMGIFEDIMMDYGDDQSLENDLSTYSSHLTNMKAMLTKGGEKSLITIDEFGSGTEPELGGVIAESILEQMNRQHMWGCITTHYANLKFYAEKEVGLQNGAMRYDVEKLQPLYKLEQGQPGSSFALEIAQKIGLPKKVVNIARHKAGRKKINMEELLRNLEEEKKEFSQKNNEVRRLEQKLKSAKEKFETRSLELQNKKQSIINKAREDAQKVLDTANKKIEHTIKEIRETNAEKERTKKLRQNMENFRVSNQPTKGSKPKKEEVTYEVIGGKITIGDAVRVKGQTTIGEVASLSSKEAEIIIGALRTKVKLNRLERISKKEFRKEVREKSIGVSAASSITQKRVDFNSQLDLRGKRAEEVMYDLDDFMDSAIMLGETSVRIVHGKGTGALREVVRNHLRTFKGIKNVSDDHPDRGGAGVTVVTLR